MQFSYLDGWLSAREGATTVVLSNGDTDANVGTTALVDGKCRPDRDKGCPGGEVGDWDGEADIIDGLDSDPFALGAMAGVETNEDEEGSPVWSIGISLADCNWCA